MANVSAQPVLDATISPSTSNDQSRCEEYYIGEASDVHASESFPLAASHLTSQTEPDAEATPCKDQDCSTSVEAFSDNRGDASHVANLFEMSTSVSQWGAIFDCAKPSLQYDCCSPSGGCHAHGAVDWDIFRLLGEGTISQKIRKRFGIYTRTCLDATVDVSPVHGAPLSLRPAPKPPDMSLVSAFTSDLQKINDSVISQASSILDEGSLKNIAKMNETVDRRIAQLRQEMLNELGLQSTT